MKAFISYSHADSEFLKRLHVHLAVLKREGAIQTWCDHDIVAGDVLNPAIDEELKSSELFLPLVSPDFLSSEYCYSVEMQQAIAMHREGRLRVVPIIIKPCDWLSTSLGQFKAVPTDGKPISEWKSQDAAFLDVTRELRKIMAIPSTTQHVEDKSIESLHLGQAPTKSAYIFKKDFDEIDRRKFRDDSFEAIYDYFASSVEDIDSVEEIKAHISRTSKTSFTCTVINTARRNGASHLTVHAGGGLSGIGEIYVSYAENSPPNTANDGFRIDTDGYQLFWKNSFTHAQGSHFNLSAQHVAEGLWSKVLASAGITAES